MKLLEMGKDMKIKDIVSLLPHAKYRGTLFVKKSFAWGNKLF